MSDTGNIIQFPGNRKPKESFPEENQKIDPVFIDIRNIVKTKRTPEKWASWLGPDHEQELSEAYFDFTSIKQAIFEEPLDGEGLQEEDALDLVHGQQFDDPIGTIELSIATAHFKKSKIDDYLASGSDLDTARDSVDRDFQDSPRGTLKIIEALREHLFSNDIDN